MTDKDEEFQREHPTANKLANIFASKVFQILLITFGIYNLITGWELIWPLFVGALMLVLGINGLYKISKRPKPVCEYCGYVALDTRELHNHQINCEKKNDQPVNPDENEKI